MGSKIAMALTALHVLATLKHQFTDSDGVPGQMLPRSKRSIVELHRAR